MASEVPSVTFADDRTLLQRYHSDPGNTPVLLEPFRDEAGRSSYQLLVEQARESGRDAHVLDLACGDGHLLELLQRQGFLRLTGVDRSPEELARARARLGSGVELLCDDARALSLPAGSMDLVLCHMALMLIEPAPPVLAGVARTLRPGGAFLVIVNRPLRDPCLRILWREVGRVTAETGMEPLRLGDRRTFSAEGLRDLFSEAPFDAGSLSIAEIEVRARRSGPDMWSILGRSYDVFRLPAGARATLRERVLGEWKALEDGRGEIPCAMGLRLVRCRTAAPQAP